MASLQTRPIIRNEFIEFSETKYFQLGAHSFFLVAKPDKTKIECKSNRQVIKAGSQKHL